MGIIFSYNIQILSCFVPSNLQCGSWAGNMMLKNKHGDFPSDLVTMMEAAGSTITIATTAEDTHTYGLTEFLTLPMHNKLIVSMEIPFLGKNERLKTFKVMPRAQVI